MRGKEELERSSHCYCKREDILSSTQINDFALSSSAGKCPELEVVTSSTARVLGDRRYPNRRGSTLWQGRISELGVLKSNTLFSSGPEGRNPKHGRANSWRHLLRQESVCGRLRCRGLRTHLVLLRAGAGTMNPGAGGGPGGVPLWATSSHLGSAGFGVGRNTLSRNHVQRALALALEARGPLRKWATVMKNFLSTTGMNQS